MDNTGDFYSLNSGSIPLRRTIKDNMTEQEQRDAAMAEFLAKGGVIQQVANGVSGRVEGVSYSAWGAPRKAGRPAAEKSIAPVDPLAEDDLDE